MQRMRLILIAIVAMLLVAGLAFWAITNTRFQKWYKPPVADLPRTDDIAEMRASLRESHVGFPHTPEFVVPTERVPTILRWLWPAQYTPDPPIFPDDELGKIQFTTKAGKEIRVRFYWAGKNGAVFTFDGIDYFYGNHTDDQGHAVDGGIRLGKAVQDAAAAAKK